MGDLQGLGNIKEIREQLNKTCIPSTEIKSTWRGRKIVTTYDGISPVTFRNQIQKLLKDESQWEGVEKELDPILNKITSRAITDDQMAKIAKVLAKSNVKIKRVEVKRESESA